jgi:hypothetical protein
MLNCVLVILRHRQGADNRYAVPCAMDAVLKLQAMKRAQVTTTHAADDSKQQECVLKVQKIQPLCRTCLLAMPRPLMP